MKIIKHTYCKASQKYEQYLHDTSFSSSLRDAKMMMISTWIVTAYIAFFALRGAVIHWNDWQHNVDADKYKWSLKLDLYIQIDFDLSIIALGNVQYCNYSVVEFAIVLTSDGAWTNRVLHYFNCSIYFEMQHLTLN